MKKILLVIFFLLIIFWFVVLSSTEKSIIITTAEGAIKSKNPAQCITLPLETQEWRTDFDGRKNFVTLYPHDDCLEYYLEKNKDSQICALFNSEENQNNCFFEIAQATKEKKWCDEIAMNDKVSSIKNKCISYIAEVYSDPSFCSEMSVVDKFYWQSSVICRAVAGLNLKECSLFDKEGYAPSSYKGIAKKNCIEEVVKRTHQYEDCLEILDKKNDCLEYAGCNQPDKRAEICQFFTYDQWTFPEEKLECLTKVWECPSVPQRIIQ